METDRKTDLATILKNSTAGRKKLLLSVDTLLDKIDKKLLELAEIIDNPKGN